MRELGKIRRVITERAVGGDLPDEELRVEYLRVAGNFERAHEAWLQSRRPAPAELSAQV